MTEVTILAFAKFRELFGEKNIVTTDSNATILAALERFAQTVPAACGELFEENRLRGHVIIMHNRERIDAEEAGEIIVRDGDEIVLYPPVSGG
ncbi:hypothetical protein McpSp1_10310 [Methanocorpusculaceae archaeon Sp1]|uniref:Molybdopterin synthase sulfur carrier subunit n=1 Tax=Methanorbis furvi TaxID=3028299 RepID=A0AAE4MDJ5_9EURY|nr:hypothetical protein [Methanocorpusculaceae archaeon Sp1]MDV0442406.1 hypothetical protein [Methanocorpusculaceae archaeon Ag1]